MSNQIEHQVKIRAEMVDLLLESNIQAQKSNSRIDLSEDLRAYAILLMIAAASLFIWFTGESLNASGIIASLVCLVIASSLILLKSFQLSTWVVRVEGWLANTISSVKARILKC